MPKKDPPADTEETRLLFEIKSIRYDKQNNIEIDARLNDPDFTTKDLYDGYYHYLKSSKSIDQPPDEQSGKNEEQTSDTDNFEFVRFDQENLIAQLEEPGNQCVTLKKLNVKFNGLCQLICNYVVMEDLLNQKHANDSAHLAMESFGMNVHPDYLQLIPPMIAPNALEAKIKLFALNNTQIKQSHILDTSSLGEKFLAYFFNKFPFPCKGLNQKKILKNKQVDPAVLQAGLEMLPLGGYIKVEIIHKEPFKLKNFFKLTGHSCLIKKISHDKYSFFDPGHGEWKNIGISVLVKQINAAMSENDGTHIAFLDAKKYFEKLHLPPTVSQGHENRSRR